MSLEKSALFNRIISEHDECRKAIEQAQSLNDKKKLLDWLWKVVENEHHFKEEKLIYPVLAKNKKINEGGPFCTLYFDEHITNRPSEVCKKITNKDVSWQEHQIDFKENPTSLNIPLEEHRSLRDILKFLIENKERLSDDEFLKNFGIYENMLKHHNAKEEKCFFRVCELCLSQAELDYIYAKWDTWSL